MGGYRCECEDGYDAEFRCKPACPNDPTGAPPTAPPNAPRSGSPIEPRSASPTAPRTAPPTAPSAAASAETPAASPTAPPTAPPTANTAERAGGDDDVTGSLDAILDYWPYIVSALGVIFVILLILAKIRVRPGSREQAENDESEGDTADESDDNAYGYSKGGSEQSLDSAVSVGRKPLSLYSSDDIDDL